MSSLRKDLDNLKMTDTFSLILFVLYKLRDVDEYSAISELAYVLDKDSLLGLCEYFGGLTIRIPTIDELESIVNSLLLYQYINIDHNSTADAYKKLGDLSMKQQDAITELYVKLIPILNNYNINRSGMKSYE